MLNARRMIKKIYHFLRKIGFEIFWEFNNLYFFLHKNSYDSVKKYKNLYAGKSCFIIGNGPSLCVSDLDIIQKYELVTFATNRIFNIFGKTEWRPTFYCVSDCELSFDSEVFREVEKMQPKAYFGRSQYAFIQRNLKCNYIPLYSITNRKLLDSPRFSGDIEHHIFDIATVTFFAMQIAAYMGFKDIYLIGMDHKYRYTSDKEGNIKENVGIRSYFQDSEKDKGVASIWEMDIAYECVEKYSKRFGFNVYNATRGGFLEIFRRKDLDEVFEELNKGRN